MSKSIPYNHPHTNVSCLTHTYELYLYEFNEHMAHLERERERLLASGKCHVAQARASAYPSRLSFTIYLGTVQVRSLNLCISPPLADGRRAKAEMKGYLSFKNLLKVCITMIFCLSNPEYIKEFTRQKSWLVISVVKFILISSCSVDSCIPSSCQLQNK